MQYDNCKDGEHPSHIEEIGKLNRVSGQLDGIKKMITEKRYCMDILIQLKAAKAAIKSVELNILDRHLENCLNIAMKAKNKTEIEEKIKEIRNFLKKHD